MIKIKFLLLFVLILKFTSTVFAQQKLIDSLQKKISTAKKPAEYYLFTAEMAMVVKSMDKPKSLSLISESIKNISKVETDRIKSKIYSFASIIYYNNDDYSKMSEYCDKAILLANSSKDNEANAWANYAKANFYSALEDENQLKFLFKTLNFAEKSKNYYLLSKACYYVSAFYNDKANPVLGKKYAQLSLKYAKISKSGEAKSFAWQTLGYCYGMLFLKTKTNNYKDSVIICYRKGVNEFKKDRANIAAQTQLSVLYLNTANYFYDFEPTKRDSTKTYIKLALDESIKTGQPYVETNCYGFLSEFEFETNNYDEVERLLQKADLRTRSQKTIEYQTLKQINNEFARLYELKKDYKKALFYKQEYANIAEKLTDEEQQKNGQMLDAKFELKKNQSEIKLLNDKAKLNTRQKYLFLIIGIIGILSLLLMALSYKFRLKIASQNQTLLNGAIKEKDLESKLKNEETERLKIEQKLMFAQKEQLKNELIAGNIQVEHKNELLQNLNKKIISENTDPESVKKISRILKQEIRLDKDFQESINQFKNIDPEFFNKLQEKSKTKLSGLDLKYCNYIKLNLPSKQIATLLNVEITSVRMSKYRLKQKFSLSKKDDLQDFLKSVV